jgi:hypothetical protein
MDEAFEVLTLTQTGKARIAVVLLDQPRGKYWETWAQFPTERLLRFGFVSQEDFAFFKIKHSAQDAVAEIAHFYKIFHSARLVGERFVIHLNHSLSKKILADLNNQFTDIVPCGEIVQCTALPKEANDPELRELPRLSFTAFRGRFGRIRQLIDAINSSATA